MPRALACYRQRSAKNQRGSALAEATLALTFFVVIFACVAFVRDKYSVSLAALNHARDCAWQFAFNNCDAQRLPAACADVVFERRSAEVATPLADAIAQARNGATTGAVAAAALGLVETLLSSGFGERVGVRVAADVARPELLGGGRVSSCPRGQCADYTMACNIAALGEASVAEQAWAVITR